MLIFKRKTIPKINNKHGVVVSAQQKGWMDSEQMKVWIEKVWRARIGGLGRRKSLLVYDFRAEKRSAQASAHPLSQAQGGNFLCVDFVLVCCWSSE